MHYVQRTGKGLTSWLSFVVSNCEFVIGILGQVWFLIVSIPDLCTLTYFIKLPFGTHIFVLSISEWPLKTGVTVCIFYTH